jgi:hypothetical protein
LSSQTQPTNESSKRTASFPFDAIASRKLSSANEPGSGFFSQQGDVQAPVVFSASPQKVSEVLSDLTLFASQDSFLKSCPFFLETMTLDHLCQFLLIDLCFLKKER